MNKIKTIKIKRGKIFGQATLVKTLNELLDLGFKDPKSADHVAALSEYVDDLNDVILKSYSTFIKGNGGKAEKVQGGIRPDFRTPEFIALSEEYEKDNKNEALKIKLATEGKKVEEASSKFFDAAEAWIKEDIDFEWEVKTIKFSSDVAVKPSWCKALRGLLKW